MNLVDVTFKAYTSENGYCDCTTRIPVNRDLTGVDLMYQAIVLAIRDWNEHNLYQISEKDIVSVEIIAN